MKGNRSGIGFLQWYAKTDRLLILHGVAALSVIAYHAQDAFRTTYTPLVIRGYDLSWLLLANGQMAVRVFLPSRSSPSLTLATRQ